MGDASARSALICRCIGRRVPKNSRALGACGEGSAPTLSICTTHSLPGRRLPFADSRTVLLRAPPWLAGSTAPACMQTAPILQVLELRTTAAPLSSPTVLQETPHIGESFTTGLRRPSGVYQPHSMGTVSQDLKPASGQAHSRCSSWKTLWPLGACSDSVVAAPHASDPPHATDPMAHLAACSGVQARSSESQFMRTLPEVPACRGPRRADSMPTPAAGFFLGAQLPSAARPAAARPAAALAVRWGRGTEAAGAWRPRAGPQSWPPGGGGPSSPAH